MTDSLRFFIERFEELRKQPPEPGRYYQPRAYRNAAVRFRAHTAHNCEQAKNFFNLSACPLHSVSARLELVGKTGLNPFLYPAHLLPGCDLLSDSGTTTMTMEQWAQLLLGDEAYGSNEGFYELNEQIGMTFGDGWRQDLNRDEQTLFIFHQGRAAEHALFYNLARMLAGRDVPVLSRVIQGLPDPTGVFTRLQREIERLRRRSGVEPRFLIPSNGHFDTTEANIADCNIIPLNLNCKEHRANDEQFPFRGNINLDELSELLNWIPQHIPLVYLTITNNSGGGQPVALENIRVVRQLTAKHRIPFFFDACRFAENAWFIRARESGYGDRTVPEIVREMFSYVDGFHISLKKDGLVNIGGALLIRPDGLFTRLPDYRQLLTRLTDYQILTEGHPTYGGLAGRDLKAIAEGLRMVVREEYLRTRIEQVRRFARQLETFGIPVLKPAGGHAVYFDIDRFFSGLAVRDRDYPGIALVALLLVAGHRLCELGVYAFELEDVPPPRNNFVRAAVPRLTYEDQDLFACAEAVRTVYEHRERIPKVEVLYGAGLPLRHFKSRFRFLPE
ncbi:MAG: tryptophanase [candidate division WOR-3 bacterium]